MFPDTVYKRTQIIYTGDKAGAPHRLRKRNIWNQKNGVPAQSEKFVYRQGQGVLKESRMHRPDSRQEETGMKKLATALVSAAAIMTMSTTAFAAENPAEVFDRVMEKNNAIQSVDIQSGVHSVIVAKDVLPDGQMKVDMAMHAQMDMQDTADIKYLAQVASSILGQDSYSQIFYTDGYYYVDANGVKVKYPMPLEQIVSSVQSGITTSNMESSYMRGISLREVNGRRVLAYEANTKKLNKSVKDALGAVMNTLGADLDLDMGIQEMKGAYVLDDNDYITYMTNYIVYNMEVLDQPMTCITLMETEVQNPGEPVSVTIPSTDGYEDLIGLYDGVIAGEAE